MKNIKVNPLMIAGYWLTYAGLWPLIRGPHKDLPNRKLFVDAIAHGIGSAVLVVARAQAKKSI